MTNFMRISAVRIDLPSEAFDAAVSQQLTEHLHQCDFGTHLLEVLRALKNGCHIIFAPNRYAAPPDDQHGLYLELYTYSEMGQICSRMDFSEKAMMLPATSLRRFALVPICTKATLGGIVRRLPRCPLSRMLNLCVVASKT